MREQDLLRFVWVADPQISPDGSAVAFTRVAIDADEDAYVTSIWHADVATRSVRGFTFGRGDSQPRWSPDGRFLAFVRSPKPKEPGQLCVMPADGGEARVLTSLAKGVSDPQWSPDGTRIAFLSCTNPAVDPADAQTKDKHKPKNDPARVITRPEWRMNEKGFRDPEHLDHVWVIDVAAGPPRQLTTGSTLEEAMPRWSRDGRSIQFLSDRREEPWFGHEHAALYAVAADLEAPTSGDALAVIASFAGPLRAWAEDASGRIAGVGYVHPGEWRTHNPNHLLVLEGARPLERARVLTQGKEVEVGDGISSDQHPPRGGGAMPLTWVDGDRAVLTVMARHGASRLARVEVASGAIEWLTDEQREIICGSVSADGRRVAMTAGDLTTPGDLVLLDRTSGELTTLWEPNRGLLAESKLGNVEMFWYESFDGERIQAWLVTPPGFDPAQQYPMVLEIHGGPHTAYGVGFFHEFHVLAEAGYVVLYTNPRGSTSYGERFANLIQYAYPGDDHEDLMRGVDVVVARGFVDPQRLGITGGSGGGLLTNWAITRTNRFAAAITQRCVADWAGMYHACDFTMFTPFWFRKPPFEDPDEYLARSPIHYASKIETPLMVIHSEDDWRTPIAQGEAMFRAMKQRRKPAVMIRFPGENHELSRSGAPSRRVQNQHHIRRWFDHWLQGKPAPEYALDGAMATESMHARSSAEAPATE